MEWIKSKVFPAPKPKTLSEQIIEYLPGNIPGSILSSPLTHLSPLPSSQPQQSQSLIGTTTIIKSIPVIIVGYYAIPLVITGIAWLPWIWVAYEVYTTTQVFSATYSGVRTVVKYIIPLDDIPPEDDKKKS